MQFDSSNYFITRSAVEEMQGCGSAIFIAVRVLLKLEHFVDIANYTP